MTWTARQRYLAEFVGTLGLLLSVSGAAVLTVTQGLTLPRITLISFSVGFGLIGLIYVFGDVSGAHFNPAVTIGAWVAGRFPGRDVGPYIAAQVAGAVVGLGIIAGIAFGNPTVFPAAQQSALASQCYAAGSVLCDGYGWGAAFLFEVTFTFLLVLVILFATRPESSARNLAPIGIGLTLITTNLIGISVDGASINPARSLAPALLSSMWPSGSWAIGQVWLFVVAPIVGGIVAALVDRALKP